MDSNDWGSGERRPRTVSLRRAVDADPETVWRSLTELDGLAAWLGRHEGAPLQQSARFTLWHDGVGPSRHEVVERVPPCRLALTWDFPEEAPSRVRITVEPDASRSVVALEHDGVDDPAAYAIGWQVHLDFLARYARGRPRSLEHFWADYEAAARRGRPAGDMTGSLRFGGRGRVGRVSGGRDRTSR